MVEVTGAHIASTDNLFNTFGQGSCPKLVFDMATAHLCFPTHFCEKKLLGTWSTEHIKDATTVVIKKVKILNLD